MLIAIFSNSNILAIGAKSEKKEVPDDFINWELPAGEYIVCSFKAENFEALVMDAIYKAQKYVYNTWLPNHKLQTEAFCAVRYPSHSPKRRVWRFG